jgi:hypothetical protein
MSPTQRYVWLGAALVVAVAAFFGGRGLRPEERASFVFDTDQPAYDQAAAVAALSEGGFSGFGEVPGLEGGTVLAGEVTNISADTLTLKPATGAEMTLRVSSGSPVRLIEPSTRAALRPGVTVVVRTEGDSAEAVLIVAEP